MLLRLQWHQGTSYTQKWSRMFFNFFLLKTGSFSEHTNYSVVLELWGRVELEEKNQLLKCQQPLGITLCSTWRSFCMASLCRWGLSQSQDWMMKFAAVWQLKIAKQCLNTWGCLGTHRIELVCDLFHHITLHIRFEWNSISCPGVSLCCVWSQQVTEWNLLE